MNAPPAFATATNAASYPKALGAAEAVIHYVKDMLALPPRDEETMADRRQRMLAAIERGEAAIARYLRGEP